MYTPDQIRAAGISGEISSIDVEHLITILEESKVKTTPTIDDFIYDDEYQGCIECGRLDCDKSCFEPEY